MDLEQGIKKINGVIEIQVEGFFTERYINLCKINNIKIWDIVTIGSGIVRFKLAICDFKKLKKISKKTKCKVKILDKKGLYFKAFKYRNRKFVIILLALFVFLCVASTTFIWNIDITGNTYISNEDIYKALEESGVKVGKNKLGIKTKKVINNLRVLLPDVAWIGIDIEGTNAHVKVVEKTKIVEEVKDKNVVGDIISDKSGIIQKIVVENGTPILTEGEYVEEGRILIEGKIYSDVVGIKDVQAKGKVILNTEYEYECEYNFNYQEKIYVPKEKYSIGIVINNKENYINYLDKSLKYDIIRSSCDISLFGNSISFGLYKFRIYDLVDMVQSKEDIIEKAKSGAKDYMEKKIFPNIKNPQVENIDVETVYEDEEKISLKVIYHVKEEVGYFRERN